MIVEETNKYADQKIQSTTWKPQSHVKKWTPVDNDEIYVYLRMIMLMGIIQKPTLENSNCVSPAQGIFGSILYILVLTQMSTLL
jgi:hypothetical protein